MGYLKLQNYNFILQHILEKTNIKANILSRKDQVNTTDNNKNVKVLKNELWTRQVKIKAEVVVIRKNQIVEEIILLEEIRRNQTRE